MVLYERLTNHIPELGSGPYLDETETSYLRYSPAVESFLGDFHVFLGEHPELFSADFKAVLAKQGIDWALEDMEKADPSRLDGRTIVALIQGMIRSERFCDGSIQNFLEDGVLQNWLKRLKELDETKPAPGKAGKMMKHKDVLNMVLSAMFLALALVLPLLTGQIPKIGNALCPMHIPVLLCGFLCGPWYGLAVGLTAPLLRGALFGMPPLMPKGLAMAFELAAYGLVSGLLYRLLPKKKLSIYGALLGAMIAGRLVWGAARVLLLSLGGYDFSWKAFLSGAFLTAVPGIILQLVLIPLLVMTLKRQDSYGGPGEKERK